MAPHALTDHVRIGGVEVANRLVLAPMTTQQSHPDGTLSSAEVAWLAQRARGGFATVVTGAWAVAPEGRVWPGQAGVWDDAHAAPLARLAEAYAGTATLGIVQLHHGGSRHTPEITRTEGVSASAGETWRAADDADLERLVEAHRTAALRVQDAGLGGVEIHAAHGFLPAQFLSATGNHRTGAWGGDLTGRARFLRTLVQTITTATGPDFVVGVRLTAEDERHGIDVDETAQVAAWTAEDGAGYVHLSLGDASATTRQHPGVHPVELVRAQLPSDVPVVAAGGVWTVQQARDVLAVGADLVAVGQAGIFNPDWPQRAAEDGWDPRRPPFTAEQLEEVGVTAPFRAYLAEGWPGSVA